MKESKLLLIFFSAILLLGCSSSSEDKINSEPNSEPNSLIEWEVIWEDNFENSTINNDSWIIWEGGAYNNELQYYSGSNIRLQDGYLYIDSKREHVVGSSTNIDDTPKAFNFTSGRLESKTLYSPSKPGFNGGVKFSARVKIGVGNGIWPAFWSYGDPWPTQGEVDVFEIRGGQPNVFISNYFYGNTPGINLVTGEVKTYTHSESLGNDFHIYEVELTKNNFKIYFDGNLVNQYTEGAHFIEEFYNKFQKIVINGAVGGDFFSNLDPNTIPDHVIHTIDWIRVSKIKS